MNCFEWQNRSSDHLDGTLSPALKKDADHHLEQCESCNERYKHYRMILTSISSQPRSSLPVPIRKSPFAAALPKVDMTQIGRSRWESIPWYLRTGIEAAGIVLLILVGISSGPKLRSLYERNIEQSLREFSESMNPSSDTAQVATNLPLARGKVEASGEAESGADEFAGETDDDATLDDSETDVEETEIKVGNAEIWRFNLKTDSPHEVRPKIVQMLAELKIPPTTAGIGGIEAPGGIQFDIFVPKSAVPSLKRQLQKIAPHAPDGVSGQSPMRETFTWYKTKSRRPIPEGKTRVVVWLSLM